MLPRFVSSRTAARRKPAAVSCSGLLGGRRASHFIAAMTLARRSSRQRGPQNRTGEYKPNGASHANLSRLYVNTATMEPRVGGNDTSRKDQPPETKREHGCRPDCVSRAQGGS